MVTPPPAGYCIANSRRSYNGKQAPPTVALRYQSPVYTTDDATCDGSRHLSRSHPVHIHLVPQQMNPHAMAAGTSHGRIPSAYIVLLNRRYYVLRQQAPPTVASRQHTLYFTAEDNMLR